MSAETEIKTGWHGLPSTDAHFSDEIIKMRGDKKILDCIQCGVCSGSCPVDFAMDYSPMQIIRMAQLGIKETIFSSNTIWICATCYCCSDRCPQGIDVGDMMTTLRNLAIKNGHIRTLFETMGSTIIKFGRIWDKPEFINELRIDVGLDPITTITPEELAKLIQHTNVKKLLEVKEERKS
jgi:heterodisulfide reductase subunit C